MLNEKLNKLVIARYFILTGILAFTVVIHLLKLVALNAIIASYAGIAFEYIITVFAHLSVRSEKSPPFLGQLLITLDLLIITAVMYFHGGVENRWGFLPVLVITISGLYYSLGTTIFFATFATILFAAMTWLEYFNLVPHFGSYGLRLAIWQDRNYCLDYLLGMACLYYSGAVVSGYFASEINKANNALEEKVLDRTRELEQAKAGLEEKVAARTKELQTTVEKLRRSGTAVDQSIDGIAIADLNGIVQYVNPAWAKMHGWQPESLVGKHLSVFHSEEQLKKDVVPFNDQVLKTGSNKGEIGHIRKDGSAFPTRMTTTLLKDENGTPTGFVGVAHDITERKQTEEALRESEERYRRIVEDLTELICRFLPNGTLTFVNEAYCRYFGKRPEELVGRSFMPLVPEEDRESVKSKFDSLSPERTSVTYEHRVIIPDGRLRWQQWTDRAIFDKKGALVEYQSVGRDITDRKEAEKALAERMKELEEFHDLTVGRELRMVELEKEVNALLKELGREAKYKQ
ncbi:MAG: PAS domain-containing protein [Candidatus Margulisbacteria bacterium]|nr:PAS domain-containing protein [Candidatus Margulisiibacteriota bacterium]